MKIRLKLVEVAHPVSFAAPMQRRLQDKEGLLEFDTEARLLIASPRSKPALLIPEANIVFMQEYVPEVPVNRRPEPPPVKAPRVDDTIRFTKASDGSISEHRGALDALAEADVDEE
jgi:hypothetical protein